MHASKAQKFSNIRTVGSIANTQGYEKETPLDKKETPPGRKEARKGRDVVKRLADVQGTIVDLLMDASEERNVFKDLRCSTPLMES